MYFTLLIFTLLPLVSAYNSFFEQVFGHGQQQQQGQQQNVYAHQSQAVQCSAYLCPKTLDCVPSPDACPCPYPEDIKCVVPDAQDQKSATVVCVRGGDNCKEVEALLRRTY
ncbi:hypothetical protein M422DRAFT_149088 [Sphaerobolus stellatus SS14]|nr:hypothetical protein M422DRAFT_149088 [Sphaerobolus stellatus SS14]